MNYQIHVQNTLRNTVYKLYASFHSAVYIEENNSEVKN